MCIYIYIIVYELIYNPPYIYIYIYIYIYRLTQTNTCAHNTLVIRFV